LASGSVLTIPINATVGVDSSFDLAGPGVPDLGFWSRESKFFAATIYSNGPSAGYELSSSVNTNANITSANAVNVLMPGDTVGPRDLFSFGTGSAFELNGYDGSGNFPLGQASYLGFVNKANGILQYGFIKFTLTFNIGEVINIDSVTYDNTGAAITIPAPEPGSSPLLASIPLVWWWVKRAVKASVTRAESSAVTGLCVSKDSARNLESLAGYSTTFGDSEFIQTRLVARPSAYVQETPFPYYNRLCKEMGAHE